jgi:hypothetical protein
MQLRRLDRPIIILVLLLFFFMIISVSGKENSGTSAFSIETVSALHESLDSAIRYLAVPGAVMLCRAPGGSEWIVLKRLSL